MAAGPLTILLLSITLFSAHAADQPSLDEQLFNAIADQDISAVEKALQAGADINAREERGLQTPLMKSVLMGYDGLVQLFLEKGADVTIGERDGYTPMHGAGFQGRLAIAQMLKDHGVPLRTKHDGDNYEPAVRSCWGREARHTETLKWFLDNGVPVDDIFDICMASSSNEATKELLTQRKDAKEEL